MDSDLVTAPATGGATPWLVALGAVLVGTALVVAMLRSRARSRRALERVLAETEELRREVDGLRRSSGPAARPSAQTSGEATVGYVITGVGGAEPEAAPGCSPADDQGRIEGRLFADLVLRESVVKAAGLAHGVRRALAPETRNRIRFEMGREVKRARKQRRADTREARRRLHAEQRAGVGGERLRQEGAA